MLSTDKVINVVESYARYGTEPTVSSHGVSSETIKRYLREYRKMKGKEAYENAVLSGKLRDKYTIDEIKRLVDGKDFGLTDIQDIGVVIKGSGRYRFAILTDLHLGSIYTSEPFLLKAIEVINELELDAVLLPGDITEGMSHRDGHVYELSHIGYAAQKSYAVEMLNLIQHKMYVIDGNHDRWYIKKSGAKIVEDICREVPKATFLGHDYARIRIEDGPSVGLWHGEDGSSYAHSYRMQKIVEAIMPSERPNIILAGHAHKYVSAIPQGTLAIGCGCMQSQSNWMRGKRLEAHVGFITGTLEFDGPDITGWSHRFTIPKFLGLKA